MADNLAMKLLIAGIIGAIVGAATADRYHFSAGSVYGFKRQSESGQSRPPVNPMIASARAGEARADDSIGPSRIMPSASPDRPDVGPSPTRQWRGPRPNRYLRAATTWK